MGFLHTTGSHANTEPPYHAVFIFRELTEFTLWRGWLIIFKYNYYEKRLMMPTISFAFSVFLFTMIDIDSAVSDVRFALSIIS